MSRGYNDRVLDEADRIWNRACDPFAGLTAAGDQALQAVLLVHGQVMNGGLTSGLDSNGPDEIRDAIAGFRYLRVDDAARSLADAFDAAFSGSAIADREARGEHLDALDDRVHERLEQLQDSYYAAVPADDVLEAAFRERLRESPGDFAPLD